MPATRPSTAPGRGGGGRANTRDSSGGSGGGKGRDNATSSRGSAPTKSIRTTTHRDGTRTIVTNSIVTSPDGGSVEKTTTTHLPSVPVVRRERVIGRDGKPSWKKMTTVVYPGGRKEVKIEYEKDETANDDDGITGREVDATKHPERVSSSTISTLTTSSITAPVESKSLTCSAATSSSRPVIEIQKIETKGSESKNPASHLPSHPEPVKTKAKITDEPKIDTTGSLPPLPSGSYDTSNIDTNADKIKKKPMKEEPTSSSPTQYAPIKTKSIVPDGPEIIMSASLPPLPPGAYDSSNIDNNPDEIRKKPMGSFGTSSLPPVPEQDLSENVPMPFAHEELVEEDERKKKSLKDSERSSAVSATSATSAISGDSATKSNLSEVSREMRQNLQTLVEEEKVEDDVAINQDVSPDDRNEPVPMSAQHALQNTPSSLFSESLMFPIQATLVEENEPQAQSQIRNDPQSMPEPSLPSTPVYEAVRVPDPKSQPWYKRYQFQLLVGTNLLFFALAITSLIIAILPGSGDSPSAPNSLPDGTGDPLGNAVSGAPTSFIGSAAPSISPSVVPTVAPTQGFSFPYYDPIYDNATIGFTSTLATSTTASHATSTTASTSTGLTAPRPPSPYRPPPVSSPSTVLSFSPTMESQFTPFPTFDPDAAAPGLPTRAPFVSTPFPPSPLPPSTYPPQTRPPQTVYPTLAAATGPPQTRPPLTPLPPTTSRPTRPSRHPPPTYPPSTSRPTIRQPTLASGGNQSEIKVPTLSAAPSFFATPTVGSIRTEAPTFIPLRARPTLPPSLAPSLASSESVVEEDTMEGIPPVEPVTVVEPESSTNSTVILISVSMVLFVLIMIGDVLYCVRRKRLKSEEEERKRGLQREIDEIRESDNENGRQGVESDVDGDRKDDKSKEPKNVGKGETGVGREREIENEKLIGSNNGDTSVGGSEEFKRLSKETLVMV